MSYLVLVLGNVGVGKSRLIESVASCLNSNADTNPTHFGSPLEKKQRGIEAHHTTLELDNQEHRFILV